MSPLKLEHREAPGLLWTLGESDSSLVTVWIDARPETPLSSSDLARLDAARQLFPEADFAIPLSWLANGLNMVRQRHNFSRRHGTIFVFAPPNVLPRKLRLWSNFAASKVIFSDEHFDRADLEWI